eukprot:5148083-Prymnesium_polylepis.1
MDAASRTTMLDTRPVSLEDQFPNDTNASCFLRSMEGGVQGCGGATNFTVGAYHEALSAVQRLYQDVDFECDADDTYLGGAVTSQG